MIKPKNIIVRMPNWLGDLVMATPVLSDLREAFPEARITAMCQGSVSELLEGDGAIDELFRFTRPANSFLRRDDLRDIIARIRQGKYDVGILLTNSFSSAWWFWQGGVGRRIGYSAHFRRLLLTHALVKKEGHLVDVYKRLLAPLGVSVSKTKPRLFVSQEEVDASKELLYKRGYRKGKKLIGVNPGAAYGSAKCWPPERYRALAELLLKKTDAHLVFFGDTSQTSLIRQICQGLSERVINLAGVTSLREMACLIKDCDVLVTNDSGPMHVGAAFGVKLVALFGSTETATGPYGQEEAVIHKHPACSPCFKRTCPLDFRCMKEISVEEVAQKCLEN